MPFLFYIHGAHKEFSKSKGLDNRWQLCPLQWHIPCARITVVFLVPSPEEHHTQASEINYGLPTSRHE